MDFVEKAKIRLEHWRTHNDHHHEEYQLFAEQLEDAGKTKSATHIREMIELSSKMSDCLGDALKELEQ
jgi:formyltetrahydrofolate hydrolase